VGDAFGVSRREQRVDAARREQAGQNRLPNPGAVEHHPEVGHPRLEIGQRHIAAREAHPAVVVQDHPSERREAADERASPRGVPLEIDVPRPVRLIDDIERTVSERLVAEVDAVGRHCIARLDLRAHPAVILAFDRRRSQARPLDGQRLLTLWHKAR
jgi:hypothetical protein